MYKTVMILLVLGLSIQAFQFLKLAFYPAVDLIPVSGFVRSMAMLPSLAVSVLTLDLYCKKNAASFWVYLGVTILHSGIIFNIIYSIWLIGPSAGLGASSTTQIITAGSLVAGALFLVKVIICYFMWKLIKRGELHYTSVSE